MKFFTSVTILVVTELSLIAFTNAQSARSNKVHGHNAYGYLKTIGIPAAKRVYEYENSQFLMPRIVGGETADIVDHNYQAGLLMSLKDVGTGLCGGSIIKNNLIATAAHCWNDGQLQATCMTVVLGSNKVFSGGTRIDTCNVHMHPAWKPSLALNDVAVVYLPKPVTFSDTIAPIALPSRSDVKKDFVGELVIASGFGRTDQDAPIHLEQSLSKMAVMVISNKECLDKFPGIITASHMCTSSNSTSGFAAICNGDSGGPLVYTQSGIPCLIGIASFGSINGCNFDSTNGYSRVTSALDFFEKHMNKID